jgi:hypothetical protein
MIVDPDPHGSALISVFGSGSGSRRAKITRKNFHVSKSSIFSFVDCNFDEKNK